MIFVVIASGNQGNCLPNTSFPIKSAITFDNTCTIINQWEYVCDIQQLMP